MEDMIDSIKPVVYLPIARVAQEVADAEPGVDLSADLVLCGPFGRWTQVVTSFF